MKRKKKMLSHSRGEISITRETAYIIRKAQQCDSRVVSFGRLVLFSTQTGDAWMLDPDDQLALCLARDGEEQEYTVIDTADNYQIQWNTQYIIEGDAFTFATQEGRTVTIMGYPTEEILRACATARQ
ncbi:MAG: hypothetical protein PHO37_07500 [Kiritimatiellae bacterium]|nr:hypothetical protein [Kiritimatiellia bacterium]